MRKQIKYKSIKITEELYKILLKERDEFQKVIGGGKWSFTDTIWEFLGIANLNKEVVSNKVDSKFIRKELGHKKK